MDEKVDKVEFCLSDGNRIAWQWYRLSSNEERTKIHRFPEQLSVRDDGDGVCQTDVRQVVSKIPNEEERFDRPQT